MQYVLRVYCSTQKQQDPRLHRLHRLSPVNKNSGGKVVVFLDRVTLNNRSILVMIVDILDIFGVDQRSLFEVDSLFDKHSII